MGSKEPHPPREHVHGPGQASAVSSDVAGSDSNGGHGQDRKGRHTGLGVVVGLVVLAVVAVPAAWSGLLALWSFSGCFIECSQPEPGRGAIWAGIAIFLIALPVFAGVAVARVPLRRVWPWFLGVLVLVVVGATLAQRVV